MGQINHNLIVKKADFYILTEDSVDIRHKLVFDNIVALDRLHLLRPLHPVLHPLVGLLLLQLLENLLTAWPDHRHAHDFHRTRYPRVCP